MPEALDADASRACRSGDMNRLRSAWDSSTLSYSGRNRGGAGVSGSGRGASGRSKSSRPRSSRNVREPRAQPLDHLAHPGQAGPGLDVGEEAGPNAPR